MDPAVSIGFSPAVLEIIMQMTPIVLLVPKEVPVKNDIMQHKRNVHNTKYFGSIKPTEWYRIKGIVPPTRQLAVRQPISTKIMIIFPTRAMPLINNLNTFPGVRPFFTAYQEKQNIPNSNAYKSSVPVIMHAARAVRKAPSTHASNPICILLQTRISCFA